MCKGETSDIRPVVSELMILKDSQVAIQMGQEIQSSNVGAILTVGTPKGLSNHSDVAARHLANS